MKVLLVDPPCQRFMNFYRYYFPLGLTYLAAVLESDSNEVLVYDADHETKAKSPSFLEATESHQNYLKALQDENHPIWKEFVEVLKNFRPQLVGFSVLSVKVIAALKMASLTKHINKEITVIAGGDHLTARPQDLLRSKDVDFVVRGEGEETILALVRAIEQGGAIKDIKGLSYREDGKMKHNSSRKLIEDLDSIPFPALHCLSDLKTYRPIDLGLVVSSRGCPYGCTFCGLPVTWGPRARFRSVKNVIQEVRVVHEKYGTNYFSFRDGTFSLNRERSLEFCKELWAANIPIKWECLTKPICLDEELLEWMVRTGCDTVRIGVESGSGRILRYMKKGVSLTDVRKAVKLLKRHEFFWSTYFMLGVPIETEETIKETLAFMKEIDPPFITLSKFTPIPGTPMYNEVIKLGLLNEEKTDWSWAVNQSLDTSFVSNMNPKRFKELMKEVAAFVRENNERHAKLRTDHRLIDN